MKYLLLWNIHYRIKSDQMKWDCNRKYNMSVSSNEKLHQLSDNNIDLTIKNSKG